MQGRLILGLVIALFSANAALAETGYIRAREARVMKAPSAAADQVVALHKGDKIEIIKHQGRWLKVTAGQQEGWVSSLLVGSRPPMHKITVLDGKDGNSLEDSARRRASASTSAAAARGLRSDERARQSDEGVADFGAVREMESTGVSEDEAVKFMGQAN